MISRTIPTTSLVFFDLNRINPCNQGNFTDQSECKNEQVPRNEGECSMKFEKTNSDLHGIQASTKSKNILLSSSNGLSSLDSNNSSNSSQCGGGNYLPYSEIQNEYFENSSLSDTQFISLSPFGENLFAYDYANEGNHGKNPMMTSCSGGSEGITNPSNADTQGQIGWSLCESDFNPSSNGLYSDSIIVQISSQSHHHHQQQQANESKLLCDLMSNDLPNQGPTSRDQQIPDSNPQYQQPSNLFHNPSLTLIPFMNSISSLNSNKASSDEQILVDCNNFRGQNLLICHGTDESAHRTGNEPGDVEKSRLNSSQEQSGGKVFTTGDPPNPSDTHYLPSTTLSTDMNFHRYPDYLPSNNNNSNSAFSLINEMSMENPSFLHAYEGDTTTTHDTNSHGGNHLNSIGNRDNSLLQNINTYPTNNFLNSNSQGDEDVTILNKQQYMSDYSELRPENTMDFLLPTSNQPPQPPPQTLGSNNMNLLNSNLANSQDIMNFSSTRCYNRSRRKSLAKLSKNREETPQERDKRVRNNEASRRSRAAKKMRVEAIINETEMLNVENRKLKIIFDEIVHAICDAKELLIKNYKNQH